ncbi:MAG: Tetratricopeptide repeat protein [Spirochaetes bacterium ADurb.Bin110]|nr:MAG: Tetratricopeptide repeat protein [Spirochaetes bacterium ADurb.Bin110]
MRYNSFFPLIIGTVAMLCIGTPRWSSAQQALPKTDVEQLKKIANEATDIEALIVRATPQSLTQASSKINASSYLSAPDKAALDAIVNTISVIVYGPKNAPFEIPAAVKEANQKYITCLVGLGDASAGKSPQIFENGACSMMSELICALPFFRSSRSEVRSQVLIAIARLEAFGGISAVPSLVRGQIAFEAKQYVEAANEFQKALELDTFSEKSACGLARAFLAQGKPEKAKQALDPIVSHSLAESSAKAGEASLSTDLKSLYGIALYNLNNILDAEPWLIAALNEDPSRTDLLVPLAHAAMQRRDYSAAWKNMEGASKIASKDRTWLILKSQYALENSRQIDAERFARTAVSYFPQDPVALAQLVQTLQKSEDKERHKEAGDLAKTVLDLTKNEVPNLTPLEQAWRKQAEDKAFQFLVMESYNNQDWIMASKYLQEAGGVPLDKEMVAIILRKSGNVQEALQFALGWYLQEPTSEKAVEAYLRSLAMVAGGGLASAAPTRDVPMAIVPGLPGLGMSKDEGANSALLDIVLKFIAAPFSKELKSFLYYMSANLQSDENKAIDQLKDALAERADNVEALVSLSSIYLNRYNRQSDKSDTTNRDKAVLYLEQAKSLHPTDDEIRERIKQLEAGLGYSSR